MPKRLIEKVWLRFLSTDDRGIVYDVLDLPTLAKLVIPFQVVKDAEYKSHWAKRGVLGYWHGCIIRQADRIDPGFQNLLEVDTTYDEDYGKCEVANKAAMSLLDTLLDTVVYGMLGICLLSAKFPTAGAMFKKKLEDRISGGAFGNGETDYPFDQIAGTLNKTLGDLAPDVEPEFTE